jgi:hypothetical protein
MKQASPALINFLNEVIGFLDGQLVMADAFLFALKNGTNLGYTNAEITFTFDGQRYLGNDILIDGLKYKCSVGLDVDKQQIDISARPDQTIPGGAEFLQALRNGALDGCEITRTRVFWSDIVGGTLVDGVVLFKGRLGSIDKIGRTSAQLTVNSDLVLLDIDMPRNIYQPTCLHTLYDPGCTLSKAAFSTNGVVGTGSTASVIKWPGARGGFFAFEACRKARQHGPGRKRFRGREIWPKKFGPRDLAQEIWPRGLAQQNLDRRIWVETTEMHRRRLLKTAQLKNGMSWEVADCFDAIQRRALWQRGIAALTAATVTKAAKSTRNTATPG